MEITKRNPIISIVRVIAMLSIIFGHLCTWADINTYQLGGIGVEIFLFISGYLYGNKKIKNYKLWLKQRALRLLPELWIAALAVSFSYSITTDFSNVGESLLLYLFNIQGFGGIFVRWQASVFPALGQTWFVTIIMVCYLLLICVKRHETWIEKHWIVTFTAIGVLVIVFGFIDIKISYILQFFCGYYVARKIDICEQKLTFSMTLFTIVICASRLFARRIIDGTSVYNNIIAPISFNVLSVWIIVAIISVFRKMGNGEVLAASRIWKHMDKLSYPLFITHYPFLKGPLSVEKFIAPKMQVLAFLFITVLTAEILLFCANMFREYVDKRVKNANED